jgi:hypothetical protein
MEQIDGRLLLSYLPGFVDRRLVGVSPFALSGIAGDQRIVDLRDPAFRGCPVVLG